MAKANNRLDDVLNDTREFEDFFHALLPALAARKLRHGDDVLPYVRELKLKIPASIRGMDITWEAEADHSHTAQKRTSETLVLARPGDANAVGLTIGCTRVGKWKICLECGWLYCRIVVTRRF